MQLRQLGRERLRRLGLGRGARREVEEIGDEEGCLRLRVELAVAERLRAQGGDSSVDGVKRCIFAFMELLVC